MSKLLNTRKALIAVAIVVAFVAIVVPTCRMVGCSMSMGGARPFGPQTTAGFFGSCGGEYVVNGTPVAVVPAGADSLALALAAAVFVAAALFSPHPTERLMAVIETASPPPPDDPRGERLRL